MKIRIETKPLNPEQLLQAEAKKHYNTVAILADCMVITVKRKPMVWWPTVWPFSLASNVQEVLCLPLPECANHTQLESLARKAGTVFANTAQTLSLKRYSAAIAHSALANRRRMFGLRIDSLWGLVTLFILGLLLSSLGSNGGEHTSALGQLASPRAAQSIAKDNAEQLSSIPAVMKAATLPPLELKAAIKDVLAGGASIELRAASAGAPTLLMFLDPLCPHCRAFEGTLAQLPSTIGLKVVPVAYQKGSKPVVAELLCSPSSAQAQRWRDVMNTALAQLKPTQSCDSGAQKADQNSVLFARAGLLSTPSLVIESSANLYASNDFSAASVNDWLKQVQH